MKDQHMAQLPICLVVGTGGMNPDTIVKGILEVNELPQPIKNDSDLHFYKWDVITKYYRASVQLCRMSGKTPVSGEVASSVNATILYFDSSQLDGIKEIDHWLPFVKEFDPEIKILVCDQCSVEEENCLPISKHKAQKWCIEHGFELVELNPTEEVDPEDDFPETLGMARIIQSLQAHSWPNLVLESTADIDKSRIEHLSRLLQGENVADSFDGVSLDASALAALQESVGDDADEEGVESFEALFQQLCSMKSQAGNLQEGSAERKAYAEKVTLAFWRAMKGDEQEIEGLDSSDQE